MTKRTSQQWALDPFGESYLLNDTIFDGPYGILRDLLQKYHITLHTYDKVNLAEIDKVLAINYHAEFINRCRQNGLTKDKLILLATEPPVVMPEQYSPIVWQQFSKIFTFRDDLIDHKTFFKLRYPQGQTLSKTMPPFSKRKFLTLINANRYSYVPNELYSLRRSAIRYFDHHPEFDLFGPRWNDRRIVISPRNIIGALKFGQLPQLTRNIVDTLKPYTSWRGSIPNKYVTLSTYKFCICFENEQKSPGYLTEKIFDCFFTGTVPIYLGASNITNYVPAESFIDMRHFSGFDSLNHFIENMKEEEWLKMHNAAQTFIHSDAFAIWQPKGAFTEIVNQLLF